MTRMPRLAAIGIREQQTIDAMIARCIETDYSCCARNESLMVFLGAGANGSSLIASSLAKGEHYLVVAMALGPSCVWLFIADRFRGLRYPLVYPAALFEITNSYHSRFWTWGTWVDRFGEAHSLLAPKEWAADSVFHGKLFEGCDDSLRTYHQMVQELELEFQLPWITEHAQALGEGHWITDADYKAQWEADPSFAMTRSPEDQRLMRNPLYGSAPDSPPISPRG
jgi:hypothetical protein